MVVGANLGFVFKFAIIGIIYLIIFLFLKIMYKDVKNIGKRKKKTIGLEVIDTGDNTNLRIGSVVPIINEITIGRNQDNILVMTDEYVSAFHARIYLKNTDYIIMDKGSTNGTYVNERKIEKAIISLSDEINIGTALFKVIG